MFCRSRPEGTVGRQIGDLDRDASREIFALSWGRLSSTYVDIRQRIYRGLIDTPKTSLSIRHAALPEVLLQEIESWRAVSIVTDEDAAVFPSERMTQM